MHRADMQEAGKEGAVRASGRIACKWQECMQLAGVRVVRNICTCVCQECKEVTGRHASDNAGRNACKRHDECMHVAGVRGSECKWQECKRLT